MLQPTSRVLLSFGLILAIASFIGSVTLYRSGKGVKFFCSAIFSAALILGTIGLQINSEREYIQTWSELPALISGEKDQPISLARIETFAKENHKTNKQAPDSSKYKVEFTPVTDSKLIGAGFTGEYLETKFSGPSSNITQPVRVWLPENWRELENLKVVVFLHGYPSNPPYAQVSLGVGKQLGGQIARDEVEPTIVVFPEIRPDDHEPDCIDIQGRPQIGSFIIEDVLQMVKANFPVSDNRADWAISGNSAGAYCAGLLAGLYPKSFGASIILSGYDDPQLGLLKNLSRSDQRKFYLSTVIGNSKAPLRVYNYAAGNDQDSRLLAQRIAQIDNANVSVTNVYSPQGSHSWESWYQAFPDALAWFAPTKTYHATSVQQLRADHIIGGAESWATRIKIEYLEVLFFIFATIWLAFLIWHFIGDRTWRKWRIETSTAAKRSACEKLSELNTGSNTQLARSSTWISAILASTVTVVLICVGCGLMINQEMGTISNLSNLTAFVQLLGL